jgi:hypothetical protein
MSKVKGWKRNHYSWDEFALRKATEYLSGTLGSVEEDLIIAYNLIRNGQYLPAQEILD